MQKNSPWGFSPVNPNLLDATREIPEKFVKGLLGEVLGGDPSNEQGPSLCGFSVDRVDEMFLARQKEMLHLDFDIVQHPAYNEKFEMDLYHEEGIQRTRKEIDKNDVCSVALLLTGANVAEYEFIKSCTVDGVYIDARNGKKDGPRQDPDR